MVEQLHRLLKTYEDGGIDRRQMLAAMLLLAGGRDAAAGQTPSASFNGRILNHVTVAVSDFDKSRAFYQKLTGATVQKEVQNQVDLRIGDSFVTVIRGNQAPGIMHFCVGIEKFSGDASMQILQRDFPGSQPRLVTNEIGQQQVILRDPDGTTVELSDPKYRL
jgi:glyoxalase/bleomycin resistance protein/dioxygenase superfamily protein